MSLTTRASIFLASLAATLIFLTSLVHADNLSLDQRLRKTPVKGEAFAPGSGAATRSPAVVSGMPISAPEKDHLPEAFEAARDETGQHIQGLMGKIDEKLNSASPAEEVKARTEAVTTVLKSSQIAVEGPSENQEVTLDRSLRGGAVQSAKLTKLSPTEIGDLNQFFYDSTITGNKSLIEFLSGDTNNVDPYHKGKLKELETRVNDYKKETDAVRKEDLLNSGVDGKYFSKDLGLDFNLVNYGLSRELLRELEIARTSCLAPEKAKELKDRLVGIRDELVSKRSGDTTDADASTAPSESASLQKFRDSIRVAISGLNDESDLVTQWSTQMNTFMSATEGKKSPTDQIKKIFNADHSKDEMRDLSQAERDAFQTLFNLDVSILTQINPSKMIAAVTQYERDVAKEVEVKAEKSEADKKLDAKVTAISQVISQIDHCAEEREIVERNVKGITETALNDTKTPVELWSGTARLRRVIKQSDEVVKSADRLITVQQGN